MLRGDWKDILGGGALVVLGGAYVFGALRLDLGTARVMGPGYYPMVVAIVTMGVGGLIMLLGAIRRYESLPLPRWRPLLMVLASFATFGFVMRHAGFVPGLFLTVIVASLADPASRPLSTVALAAGAAGGAWLIFIAGLGLPIPAFRTVF